MIEATRDTETVLDFGDGQYRFFLPLREVGEFESKHEPILSAQPRLHAAIGFTKDRKPVLIEEARVDANLCRDVIRLALIGGNEGETDQGVEEVGPNRAKELVDLYAYPNRPLEETAALAWQILATAVYGRKKLLGDGDN